MQRTIKKELRLIADSDSLRELFYPDLKFICQFYLNMPKA